MSKSVKKTKTGKDEAEAASTGVRSVERCIDILDLLVAHDKALSLTELAAEIGAPKSTVLTILRSLLNRGLVAYNAQTRLYKVGLGFTRYARPNIEVGLRDISFPHLQALVDETAETVTLAMSDGRSVYYLARIIGPQPLQYAIPIGLPRPMHATAAGKVLLSYMSEAERESYYKKVGLFQLTNRTITDRNTLEAQLRACRKNGYAAARGETAGDIFGVAAPIFDSSNKVVAAVNLGGPLSRFRDGEAKYVPAITRAAQAISADILKLGKGFNSAL